MELVGILTHGLLLAWWMSHFYVSVLPHMIDTPGHCFDLMIQVRCKRLLGYNTDFLGAGYVHSIAECHIRLVHICFFRIYKNVHISMDLWWWKCKDFYFRPKLGNAEVSKYNEKPCTFKYTNREMKLTLSIYFRFQFCFKGYYLNYMKQLQWHVSYTK